MRLNLQLQKYLGRPDEGSVYNQKRLPEAEAMELFKQLVSAVSFLHQHKVIHRDIKPANIMLQTTGTNLVAKLGDLGLAKQFESQEGILAEATRGMLTQYYGAPECWLEFPTEKDKQIPPG